MGFKKCEPHKKHSEDWEPYSFRLTSPEYKMVPDTHEMKYQTVNGKRVSMKVKKVHPKWRMFYKLKFNELINIWVDVNNGQILTIYLEGNIVKDGVEEIYESYKHGSIILDSKKDIIKLFPKAIQRDFIINDLFN